MFARVGSCRPVSAASARPSIAPRPAASRPATSLARPARAFSHSARSAEARPIRVAEDEGPQMMGWGLGGALLLAGALLALSNDDDTVIAAEQPAGTPGTERERTFIAIKPDGVQRGLIGEIIERFEKKGYKLVAIKVIQPTEAFAKQHYADLAQKPFFPALVKYFSSGPVVAMVWEGKNAIANGRKLIGATNPANAEPGSIRGDLCIETGRNIIHGSDGKESAHDEINLWFKPQDFVDYKLANQPWLYDLK